MGNVIKMDISLAAGLREVHLQKQIVPPFLLIIALNSSESRDHLEGDGKELLGRREIGCMCFLLLDLCSWELLSWEHCATSHFLMFKTALLIVRPHPEHQ